MTRPDVSVRNWYRTNKNKEGASQAHLKTWVVAGNDGEPLAALVGSANLTRAGLQDNAELGVEANGDDLIRAWDMTNDLHRRAWDCRDRLNGYLGDRKREQARVKQSGKRPRQNDSVLPPPPPRPPPPPPPPPPQRSSLRPPQAVLREQMPANSSFQVDPQLAYAPMRSYGAMLALAVFFPIHFFFLRKVGLGVAFWVTALVGWIVLYIPHFLWWFVNLFLVKRWVSEYNDAVLIAHQQQF